MSEQARTVLEMKQVLNHYGAESLPFMNSPGEALAGSALYVQAAVIASLSG